MIFSALQVVFALASVAAGLSYGLVWHGRAPSQTRTVVKTAAVGALAFLSLVSGGPLLLTMALALSALGDAFISRDGEKWFIGGLVSFLLAHVAYVIVIGEMAQGYDAPRLAAAAALALFAALTLRWLWPHLGDMRWPVAAYVGVIFAMGVAAVGAPAALWPLWAGAALFMASDTVLAAETFVHKDRPRGWTGPFVWWTYYPAQVLLAAGFLCPAFAAA